MLKIALLCDIDPVEALALLNLWRCDEAARGTYQRLLDVAQSTALKSFPYIIGISLACGANFQKANAFSALDSKQNENISHKVSQFHHYAIFKETFWFTFRLLSLFLKPLLSRPKYSRRVGLGT